MPICPKCRGEYRQEILVCAHCDVPLVPDEQHIPDNPLGTPEKMAALLSEKELAVLATGSPGGVADLRDQLARWAGLPSIVAAPSAGGTCQPRLAVFVASEQLSAARKFFDDGFEPAFRSELVQLVDEEAQDEELDEASFAECPACGADTARRQGPECPECGLFLG